MNLLIIEDDKDFSKEMQAYFEKEFHVLTAGTIAEAKRILGNAQPDCAILDLLLPDGNSLFLLTEGYLSCPTVILTSVVTDQSVIDGMDAGAEDYVFKPCSMPVLAKRLERRLPGKAKALKFGDLVIDSAKRTVSYRAVPIRLTSTEFNILYFLAAHENETYTVTEIYEAVWEMAALGSKSSKVHLYYLRRKLEEAAKDEKFIYTDFGKGYRFSWGGETTTREKTV